MQPMPTFLARRGRDVCTIGVMSRKLRELGHGLVGTGLLSVAYFGGLGAFVAGSYVTAVALIALGSVAFSRWRTNVLRGRALPEAPTARLLGDGRNNQPDE